MIVEIGGKFLNPEHVTYVEYRPGNTSCVLHLISGKTLDVSQSRGVAVEAINEAIWPPRRITTGMPATGANDLVPGPLLALPASGDVDRDALIMHLANLINDHQNDLDFCRSTRNTMSGKTVAAACHERSVYELTDLLRRVKGES